MSAQKSSLNWQLHLSHSRKKNGSIFKIMSVLTASASDLPVQGNKEWSKAGEGLDWHQHPYEKNPEKKSEISSQGNLCYQKALVFYLVSVLHQHPTGDSNSATLHCKWRETASSLYWRLIKGEKKALLGYKSGNGPVTASLREASETSREGFAVDFDIQTLVHLLLNSCWGFLAKALSL